MFASSLNAGSGFDGEDNFGSCGQKITTKCELCVSACSIVLAFMHVSHGGLSSHAVGSISLILGTFYLYQEE